MIEDTIYRIIELPANIHGFVMESPDGYRNIYINSNDSPARQQKTIAHEEAHILLGHVGSDRTRSELEDEINV